MALRLNLYHEVQALELERKRDPLKIGMMVLGGIIALCLGAYFLRMHQVGGIEDSKVELEAKWTDLTKKAEKARARTQELKDLYAMDAALTGVSKSRPYWAPRLQFLIEAIPPYVELVGITAGPSQTGTTGSYTFSIDGRAVGAEPRLTAEQFRQDLQKHFTTEKIAGTATFRSLEEAAERLDISGSNVGKAQFSMLLEVTAKPENGKPGENKPQ